jgi:hypothetical protein
MNTSIEKLRAKSIVLSNKKSNSFITFNDTKINYVAPLALALALFGFFFLPISGTVLSLIACLFSFKIMRKEKATGLYTTYTALVLASLQAAFFLIVGAVYMLTAGVALLY